MLLPVVLLSVGLIPPVMLRSDVGSSEVFPLIFSPVLYNVAAQPGSLPDEWLSDCCTSFETISGETEQLKMHPDASPRSLLIYQSVTLHVCPPHTAFCLLLSDILYMLCRSYLHTISFNYLLTSLSYLTINNRPFHLTCWLFSVLIINESWRRIR